MVLRPGQEVFWHWGAPTHHTVLAKVVGFTRSMVVIGFEYGEAGQKRYREARVTQKRLLPVEKANKRAFHKWQRVVGNTGLYARQIRQAASNPGFLAAGTVS